MSSTAGAEGVTVHMGMTAAPALGRFLEVGPRPDRLGPEWTTVGLEDNAYTDFKAIWGVQPLPFPDASFEEFYASHVIEHIPWWRILDALKEAHRVLKPGGLVEIHTVDFAVLVACYLNRAKADGWKGGGRNTDGHHLAWINSRIFSYGDFFHDPQWHRACLDADWLAELLVKAGFSSPERCGPPRGPEKHGKIDLGMKAVKP